MSEIIFSHRPAAGVSVAATNRGSRLFVAIALVNDGTSLNGVMWPERRDSFSRTTARQILTGRIERAAAAHELAFVRVVARDDEQVPMTFVFENGPEARRFIARLRPVFKPDAQEGDLTFSDIEVSNGVQVRYRMFAATIFEKTATMINEVVADIMCEMNKV